MSNEFRKYTGENLPVAAHRSPYPTQRLSPPVALVDAAGELERAAESISHQTQAQLRLIAKQIRMLQEEARQILEKAERDVSLHEAEFAMRRIPGALYHLYRRDNGTLYFSLLSPADYGGRPPHPFEGSYRLEHDSTWTRV